MGTGPSAGPAEEPPASSKAAGTAAKRRRRVTRIGPHVGASASFGSSFIRRRPAKLKLLAMFAAFYVLSPIDLVPGGLFGPLGWLDDILIALYAWNRAGGILRRGPWAARAGQG